MGDNELVKRAQELARRSEKSGKICTSGFLSPAERYAVEALSRREGFRAVFFGGQRDSERTLAFFLPEYAAEDDIDFSAHIRAIKYTAHFGSPGHRDYMGAVLGMGIGREWVGDILLKDETAFVFCLPSVQKHLLGMDRAGRVSLSAEEVELSAVPENTRQVQSISFSVQSLRLDAVTGAMFRLSRTEAAKHINAGAVSLNYSPCIKTDAGVGEGDIISLRGAGKGMITGMGGTSRKGRLFVHADIYK